MRRLAVALVGSLLTAAYWSAVFAITCADVLFAGDRAPAAQPAADREVVARNAIVIAVAVLLYAAALLAWRGIAGWLRARSCARRRYSRRGSARLA